MSIPKDVYLSPFASVKEHLKKVYLNTAKLSPLLSKLDRIKHISIKHTESSVVPFVYILGTIEYITINKHLEIEPKALTNELVHIGYKRADELLDLKGVPLHVSKTILYTLFKLKYPSFIKRVYFFLKFLISK